MLLSLKLTIFQCACGCKKTWRALPESTSKYWSITHDPKFDATQEREFNPDMLGRRKFKTDRILNDEDECNNEP